MTGPFNLSAMTTAVCLLLPLAAQAQAPRPALPDGPGKQLVDGVCTGCHQTNMITQSSGYTREDWGTLIGTMIDLKGVPDQQEGLPRAPAPLGVAVSDEGRVFVTSTQPADGFSRSISTR